MAISNDTNYSTDILQSWLQKIAENTARMRDAMGINGGGGGGSTDKAREDGKQESRFEKLGKRIEQALASQVGARLAQAQGLANRGFGGTVEGARHDFAMEQLGRQFAAVMMPVMQAATYLATQIEQRMRMMNGGEQNRLMGGLLGAGIGMRYGPLGAFAGGMLGMTAMDGGGTNDSLRGAAAGAYLGWRTGGPWGAAAGLFAGGVAGAPAHRGDERPFDYYDRLRREGSSRFGAVWATGMRAVGVRVGAVDEAPGGVIGMGRRAATDAHREVTPFTSQMEDPGATYMRAQEAMIRATAGAGFEADGGPLKPVVDALLMIFDLLASVVRTEGGGAIAPAGARR
jgi:hypothetical protein